MTETNAEQLIEINKLIAEMEPKDRVFVERFANHFRSVLKEGGHHAGCAYAQVGCEMAVMVEREALSNKH